MLAPLALLGSLDSTPQALTEPGQAGTKVAVLLSGALRTLDWCTESLRTNLVLANPGMTFDFFAYLTADDGIDRGAMERSVGASLRNVSSTEPKVRVVTESEALAAVMQALMPHMQTMPAGRGTATGKSRNIIQMFYGIAGAATLLSETTGGNAPKSKLQSCNGAEGGAETIAVAAKYDLILRTRPDLCLCEPLDLHQVRLVAANSARSPSHMAHSAHTAGRFTKTLPPRFTCRGLTCGKTALLLRATTLSTRWHSFVLHRLCATQTGSPACAMR